MRANYALRMAAILAAVSCIGMMSAVLSPGPAQAKMVTNAVCQWFGTAPVCAGRCPGGWEQKKRSDKGCLTGSKAYCCDFKEYCVPDKKAHLWDPKTRKEERTASSINTLCQRCTKWGDDCKGGMRFQTLCVSYTWYICGSRPLDPNQPQKCPPGLMGRNCDQVIVR
jgi:hypothetical protein